MVYTHSMADSWMDHIPTHEREKIRRRMRSPEAYEALRENVKGPEDLEREMRRNERMAEVQFSLETQPEARETLRAALQDDIAEHGMESVFDLPSALSDAARAAIVDGKFTVQVQSMPDGHDKLTAVPEGNVHDRLPVKPSFANTYIGQLAGRTPPSAGEVH